jgi:hypothetical protein
VSRQRVEGKIYMTKISNHSQDYERKHVHNHKVRDKATLKEEYIDNQIRKAADRKKDKHHLIRTPDEGK